MPTIGVAPLERVVHQQSAAPPHPHLNRASADRRGQNTRGEAPSPLGPGPLPGLFGRQPSQGPGAPDDVVAAARLQSPDQGLRSKDWSEFAAPGAPPLDFVFTVCDAAANEVCPVWPGQPMTAHWGVEDPAAFVGNDEKTYAFFKRVYGYLDNRIKMTVPSRWRTASFWFAPRAPGRKGAAGRPLRLHTFSIRSAHCPRACARA